MREIDGRELDRTDADGQTLEAPPHRRARYAAGPWTTRMACATLFPCAPTRGAMPVGPGGHRPGRVPGKGIPMTRNGNESTPIAARTGLEGRSRGSRTVRGRGGRRLLAPFVGMAAAAALIAGCGGAGTEEPAAGPDGETTEAAPTSEQATESAPDPSDGGGATSDDPEADEPDGGDATGENLFEGTWGFGHDTKVLSAEELAVLLEAEAEARGPEEMSLDVECGDGVDTSAADYDAECIAYADEGVEHLWLVTVGPADAGLEIEVENEG